ncbi:MAG: hypothetical protein WCF78_01760 [archaeon]
MKKKFIILLIVTILVLSIGFILYKFSPTEKQVSKEIIKANYCSVKEDCISVGPSCPFGCSILINKNEEIRISSLISKYNGGIKGCVYSCMELQGINCVNNKCEPLLTVPGNI